MRDRVNPQIIDRVRSRQNPNTLFKAKQDKQEDKDAIDRSCSADKTICQVGLADGKGRYVMKGDADNGLLPRYLMEGVLNCRNLTTVVYAEIPYSDQADFPRSLPARINGIWVYAEQGLPRYYYQEGCMLAQIETQAQLVDDFSSIAVLLAGGCTMATITFCLLLVLVYRGCRQQPNRLDREVGLLEANAGGNYGSINRSARDLGTYTPRMWEYLDAFEGKVSYTEQLDKLAKRKVTLLSPEEKAELDAEQSFLPPGLRQSYAASIADKFLEGQEELVDEYLTKSLMNQPVWLYGTAYELSYLRDGILIRGNGRDPVKGRAFSLGDLQPAISINKKIQVHLQALEAEISATEALQTTSRFAELPFNSEIDGDENEEEFVSTIRLGG